jgi:hypothetical protein
LGLVTSSAVRKSDRDIHEAIDKERTQQTANVKDVVQVNSRPQTSCAKHELNLLKELELALAIPTHTANA